MRDFFERFEVEPQVEVYPLKDENQELRKKVEQYKYEKYWWRDRCKDLEEEHAFASKILWKETFLPKVDVFLLLKGRETSDLWKELNQLKEGNFFGSLHITSPLTSHSEKVYEPDYYSVKLRKTQPCDWQHKCSRLSLTAACLLRQVSQEVLDQLPVLPASAGCHCHIFAGQVLL